MARRSRTQTPRQQSLAAQRRGTRAQSRVVSRELSALIEMPRIELPAGVSHVQVTEIDMQNAVLVENLGEARSLEQAREYLREGRALIRLAGRRPASKARKAAAERSLAVDHLVNAGILCGVVELLRAGMMPRAERLARLREHCREQAAREVGAFAVRVENWTRDLAGESRLTRG